MRAEDRAYLRAIIESHDSDVRPADRIKCVELLRGEPDEPNLETAIRSSVGELSDEELDREYDLLVLADEVGDLLAGDEAATGRYPHAAAVVAKWRDRLSQELGRASCPCGEL
jgi:hypothetical protein